LSLGAAAWYSWTNGHPGAVILGAVSLYFLMDTI
jgi:hypothetical protein